MSDEPENCPRCEQPKHRGRCKSTTLADVVKKHATPKRPKAPRPLELERSYGLRANWEGDFLHLEQDQEGNDGEIVTPAIALARSDVRKLLDYLKATVAA